jgi:hypothetical protein
VAGQLFDLLWHAATAVQGPPAKTFVFEIPVICGPR